MRKTLVPAKFILLYRSQLKICLVYAEMSNFCDNGIFHQLVISFNMRAQARRHS